MGSIMNGITLHGGTRRVRRHVPGLQRLHAPAVRLAALMKLPVTYVWTHDSIGLGEDGPTHQPIEHLAALRAIPGLDVVRPADANETAVAWRTVLEHTDRPAGAGADPAERADLRPRRCCGSAEGVAQGRLRPGRGVRRPAAGDPHRHRLRGAARPRPPGSGWRPRAPRPGSCRCRAWSGSASRTRPTSSRCCRAASRPGSASRPAIAMGWRDVVGDAGEMRQHRALRRERRRTPCCSSSSASPPTGSWPRPTPSLDQGRRHHRHHDRQLSHSERGSTP